MKVDMRKQAALGSLIKDNTADWKNLANKEIEENKSLKEKIASLELELENKQQSDIFEVDPNRCTNWMYSDRSHFELGDIDDLAEDIKANGQLQPAIVRAIESLDFDYEIIGGERRWRACSLAKIPLKAVLIDKDDLDCLIIQTSENKKQQLSPYSLAKTYLKMMENLNISQNELSKRLNIPKSSFSELMSFNKVPPEIWEAVADMTLVSAKTASFLSKTCDKGLIYQNALITAANKIREGAGESTLTNLIGKAINNSKTSRNASRVYENERGEMLFRLTTEGRITISKSFLNSINLDDLASLLQEFILEKTSNVRGANTD